MVENLKSQNLLYRKKTAALKKPKAMKIRRVKGPPMLDINTDPQVQLQAIKSNVPAFGQQNTRNHRYPSWLLPPATLNNSHQVFS